MKKAGFTLIELMVVIAIIGILGVVITPVVGKAIEKAKVARAIATISTIDGALVRYNIDTGLWPATAPGPPVLWYVLDHNALLQDDGQIGWDGPYLKSWDDNDPWGGVLQIRTERLADPGLEWHNSDTVDLFITFNNNGAIFVPTSAAQRIDDSIDDGNFDTGNVTRSCSSSSGNCEMFVGVYILGYR
jgi:general secretion pathway protein G